MRQSCKRNEKPKKSNETKRTKFEKAKRTSNSYNERFRIFFKIKRIGNEFSLILFIVFTDCQIKSIAPNFITIFGLLAAFSAFFAAFRVFDPIKNYLKQ